MRIQKNQATFLAVLLSFMATATPIRANDTTKLFGSAVVSFVINADHPSCTIEPFTVLMTSKEIDGKWHNKSSFIDVACYGKGIRYILSLKNSGEFITHRKTKRKIQYVTFVNKKTKCNTDLFIKAKNSNLYDVDNKNNNLIPDGVNNPASFIIADGQGNHTLKLNIMFRAMCDKQSSMHKENIAFNTNLDMRNSN